MKTMTRIALAAALAALAAPALATTVTGTFTVTATVQKTCAFGTANALTFGTYDTMGAAVDATTTFDFRCNKGTAYQIQIDNGSNAAGGVRRMKGDTLASDFLSYQLFKDAARLLPWGAALGTDTLDGTAANASPINPTIYARIPANQDVSAQGYTDATVTITVNY